MTDTKARLERMQPDKGAHRYLLGVFESGVTVYKQQLRALNLIDALHRNNLITSNTTIAIIGAGFAGLTAAAAALRLEAKVTLLERGAHPLHIQAGCETRWLHPHIYDWPMPGAENPDAELPLLSWTAGTASSVVASLLQEWKEVGNHVEQHYGTQASAKGNSVTWTDGPKRIRHTQSFDIVVFAVGFGVEKDISGVPATSYWRNEPLHQSDLSPGIAAGRILITGTGDGGLIDLQRATLLNYRQDLLVGEFFSGAESLLTKLRSIAAGPAGQDASKAISELDALHHSGAFQCVDDRIRERLRPDVRVTLHGQASDFGLALSSQRISFLNRVLTHRLWHCAAFDYCSDPIADVPALHQRGHIVSFKSGRTEGYDRIVVRHGTERTRVLEPAGYVKTKSYEDAVSTFSTAGEPDRDWPPGTWSKTLKIEYVAPAVSAIASVFCSTLAGCLRSWLRDLDFRVTIHRVFEAAEKAHLQQVCPYFGTRAEAKNVAGRVFPLSSGLIGLAAATHRALSVKDIHDDFNAFAADMKTLQLGIGGAREVDKTSVRSLLALPFLGQSGVVLVLFADSIQEGFFQRDDVLRAIIASSQDFVQCVEQSLDTRDIGAPSQASTPAQPVPNTLSTVVDASGLLTRLGLQLPAFTNLRRFAIAWK